MEFHRSLMDTQIGGDLFVQFSLYDMLQDFILAGR